MIKLKENELIHEINTVGMMIAGAGLPSIHDVHFISVLNYFTQMFGMHNTDKNYLLLTAEKDSKIIADHTDEEFAQILVDNGNQMYLMQEKGNYNSAWLDKNEYNTPESMIKAINNTYKNIPVQIFGLANEWFGEDTFDFAKKLSAGRKVQVFLDEFVQAQYKNQEVMFNSFYELKKLQ